MTRASEMRQRRKEEVEEGNKKQIYKARSSTSQQLHSPAPVTLYSGDTWIAHTLWCLFFLRCKGTNWRLGTTFCLGKDSSERHLQEDGAEERYRAIFPQPRFIFALFLLSHYSKRANAQCEHGSGETSVATITAPDSWQTRSVDSYLRVDL